MYSKNTRIFLVLVIVLVCAIGAYALHQYVGKERSGIIDSENSDTDLLPPREAPNGLLEYRNTRFRFSLFYPEEMDVETYNEGGSAMTFTFNDPEGRSFQIFIVRYREQEVTEERFRKDAPSGVREDARNVTIDGTAAVSFYGKDALVGETAEVWFVHGGYLYEVTAPKPLAGWLSEIMQTWKFLI